ncbi:Uncharacterised protein [Trueperella bialowiezensis]|uniref:Uncharacterized protein n=1 Tax=Trueperella bialowiezensis TaxID=312285 RepID=A0A448PFJ0_9ACTO|nr:Uncharacterised protein [Trueperella bialowiezensis]
MVSISRRASRATEEIPVTVWAWLTKHLDVRGAPIAHAAPGALAGRKAAVSLARMRTGSHASKVTVGLGRKLAVGLPRKIALSVGGGQIRSAEPVGRRGTASRRNDAEKTALSRPESAFPLAESLRRQAGRPQLVGRQERA